MKRRGTEEAQRRQNMSGDGQVINEDRLQGMILESELGLGITTTKNTYIIENY